MTVTIYVVFHIVFGCMCYVFVFVIDIWNRLVKSRFFTSALGMGWERDSNHGMGWGWGQILSPCSSLPQSGSVINNTCSFFPDCSCVSFRLNNIFACFFVACGNVKFCNVSRRTAQFRRLALHCVQKKNTHSHFLSYLHELFVDLNKNCSE